MRRRFGPAVTVLQNADVQEAVSALIAWAQNPSDWALRKAAVVQGMEAGQGQSAVSEFQKLASQRGVVGNSILGALIQLQLGRAKVLAGDQAGGRKAYQDFFELWKDADANVPILLRAKTEYAKLQ